jgi:hypothetical protein
MPGPGGNARDDQTPTATIPPKTTVTLDAGLGINISRARPVDLEVDVMLLYHLLSSQYALDDLRKGRIKISKFSDLNDPFELLATELPEKATRQIFSRWRKQIASTRGVICFSRSWDNPVLWSHYGDKHRGIALGFEVSDPIVEQVRYVGQRLADQVSRGILKAKLGHAAKCQTRWAIQGIWSRCVSGQRNHK